VGVNKLAKREYRDKVIIKKRMLMVFSILFLLFFLLLCREFYLMIGQSGKLTAIATDQWTSSVKIDAKRGRILDRNGYELAISANVYRVDLDMNTLRDTLKKKGMTNEELAPNLAAALDMESADVLKELNRTLANGLPRASATLKRRIEKAAADKATDLRLPGIIISPDTRRYYPEDNFLSQVLGHTNSDGKGLTGVEMQYDSILSGVPGVLIAETDNKSKELPYSISQYTKPVDGKDLVLTIDEMIQHFCEKAADQALIDNKAKAVTIMVMDPKTGEILALVNKPDYNPNSPWVVGKTSDELQKMWRNRAVSDAYEPGSIFKVITAVAAMEENTITDNEKFVCNGNITIAKSTIHCWKTSGHGTQSFIEILKNSCNVGFMEVGKNLGKEKLNKYVELLGFGKKTGIDLPGEAKGITKKTKDISVVDLATMSFGHANAVSAIQYLTAFNSVANGGFLITPHVMKETARFDEDNKKYDEKEYQIEKKKVLDSDIVATLRGYLEKVVSEGGSKNAFIEGYHIAGKTGTALKLGAKGGYETGKYISSFAGMAPSNDPRITVFVSIEEPDPSNYYAGQIAAPVGKVIFNDIFNYLALQPDASGEAVAKSLLKDVLIPNIRGLKKADAIKNLRDQHLDFEINGSGDYVTDVNPIPGFTVKEGTKVVLYMGNTSNYNNKVVVVPDLRGYNRDKVIAILNGVGLKAVFNGEGLAAEQNINAGEQVRVGTSLTVKLDSIGD
jgi:stage V sporulation protein D (sporulation-specific penicillin-binding protein)